MNVLMPETANVVKWLKAEGDRVHRGDVLLEVETDKTVLQVEAEADGTLQSILVPEGTAAVPANATVGTLLAEGEAAAVAPASASSAAPAAAPAAAIASAALTAASSSAQGVVATTATVDAPVAVAAATAPVASPGGRQFSSPLARRLAREAGVAIAGILGSGPGGRVVERDVKALLARHAGSKAVSPPRAPETPPTSAATAQNVFAAGTYDEVPLDGMRSTIAQRLQASKQTVPHFYLSIDVELDAVLALRQQLNAGAHRDAQDTPAYKLTLNDFVVRALALALQRVPQANAAWGGDRILRFHRCDVGVAVAVDGGLYTPVVRGAEAKTLSAISNEIRALSHKARQRSLRSDDCQGGATSVSNLGMHGIKEFAAIINPPQSTMLAVGEAGERVVAKGGAPAVVQAMTVTLSCDHRVVDGALGAQLLKEFKALMQQPMNLLV